MPLHVERLRSLPTSETTMGFVVDLFSPGEFDPRRFDAQVRSLSRNRFAAFEDAGDAKFIVVSDRLLLFPQTIYHADAYRVSKQIGLVGVLQSAGSLIFNLTGKDLYVAGHIAYEQVRRKFSSYSSSLEKQGFLDRATSDAYKLSVLKAAFAEHAVVE